MSMCMWRIGIRYKGEVSRLYNALCRAEHSAPYVLRQFFDNQD
jgi:hypothetical protein